MPTLNVKDVPGPLYSALRVRAQKAHRTIRGELLAILEDAIEQDDRSVHEVIADIEALQQEHTTKRSATLLIGRDRAR